MDAKQALSVLRSDKLHQQLTRETVHAASLLPTGDPPPDISSIKENLAAEVRAVLISVSLTDVEASAAWVDRRFCLARRPYSQLLE